VDYSELYLLVLVVFRGIIKVQNKGGLKRFLEYKGKRLHNIHLALQLVLSSSLKFKLLSGSITEHSVIKLDQNDNKYFFMHTWIYIAIVNFGMCVYFLLIKFKDLMAVDPVQEFSYSTSLQWLTFRSSSLAQVDRSLIYDDHQLI